MIKLAENTIDQSDLQALSDWLLTNPQLTMGSLTEEFEQKFAEWYGTKYAVMVNSGSSANLLMLYALICDGTLQPGNKVVVPSVCWSTDVAPIIQLGLKPIFCDVSDRNLAIDPIKLEEAFEEYKPQALLLVSILGLIPDEGDISYLCKKYNVTLLFDNCEGLGSRDNGHLTGSYSAMVTTSLYFGHHISTIEGGVIFTNYEYLHTALLMLRAHGWDRNLLPYKKEKIRQANRISEFNARYTFYYPGFNFRPTEINAFLGLRQLQRLDSLICKREENFRFYQNNIKNDTWKPLIAKEDFVSNLGYPIIHKNRDKIVEALKDVCETRPLVSGDITQQPAYSKYAHSANYPAAQMVQKYGMYVPNHPYLTQSDIYQICEVINSKTR